MAQYLRLIVVTPETTVIDQPVTGLQFPLYDGMIGVLPGRLPLVGRLGCGELKIHSNSSEQNYYVDGGFVQIKEGVVSLLTNQTIPADEISRAEAEKQLTQALASRPKNMAELEQKDRDQQRARRMIAIARAKS